MSSPKKMGYIGKSVTGEDDLQGEEYLQTSPYRANAERGFELIAPHLFPDAEEAESPQFARASNHFDSESFVHSVVSNVNTQHMLPVTETQMSRSHFPSKRRMLQATPARQVAPRVAESDELGFTVKQEPRDPHSVLEKLEHREGTTDPKIILDQAIKLAVKIHAPNDEAVSKRKRTNYSTMSAAEERVAREKSKKRRASLKCKREKIRRTTLNTIMDEIRKELGLPQETVDQANILSHALSYIRSQRSLTRAAEQRFLYKEQRRR